MHKCHGCGYSLEGIDSDRCPECGRGIVPLHPIARFTESRPGTKRTFFLTKTVVFVRSRKLLGDETEMPIDLLKLDPNPIYHRRRGDSSIAAIIVLVINVALLVFIFTKIDEGWNLGKLFCGACAASGTGLMWVNFRKTEYWQFVSNGQQTVLLDLARVGPEKEHFNEFIVALRKQIIAAHAASGAKQNPPAQASTNSQTHTENPPQV